MVIGLDVVNGVLIDNAVPEPLVLVAPVPVILEFELFDDVNEPVSFVNIWLCDKFINDDVYELMCPLDNVNPEINLVFDVDDWLWLPLYVLCETVNVKSFCKSAPDCVIVNPDPVNDMFLFYNTTLFEFIYIGLSNLKFELSNSIFPNVPVLSFSINFGFPTPVPSVLIVKLFAVVPNKSYAAVNVCPYRYISSWTINFETSIYCPLN